MKIIGNLSTDTYSEVGQTNPLRWMFLQEREPGVYQSSSGWIKCKDFFNDVVYYRETGTGFQIYGFACDTVGTAKDKDVSFLLKGTKEGFQDNLGALNAYLIGHDLPMITRHETERGQMIVIPSFYWTNTYYISLLSLLIRICNTKESFDLWQSVIDQKIKGDDQGLIDTVKKVGIWFDLPESHKDYFVYINDTYYGKDGQYHGSFYSNIIHDNGMLGWYRALNLIGGF